MLPLHTIVFRRMLEGIRRAAEALTAMRPTSPATRAGAA
jgi:hypothetical protein